AAAFRSGLHRELAFHARRMRVRAAACVAYAPARLVLHLARLQFQLAIERQSKSPAHRQGVAGEPVDEFREDLALHVGAAPGLDDRGGLDAADATRSSPLATA